VNNPLDLIESVIEIVKGIFCERWTLFDVIKWVIIVIVLFLAMYWLLNKVFGYDAVKRYDNSRGGQIIK
jgi:uncharacterized membrane protein